jgi:hypothetical protein
MPPPPMARAKRPAATTPAPVTVKERPPQRKPPPLSPSNAATLATLRAGDKKPLADPSQRKMQDKVGNGAVAAGLRRGPTTDPKFATLKKDVQKKKRTVATSHPPPRKEATSAQDAAQPPRDDEVAQGKTANAEKMNDAKPKDFDKDAFVKAVEKAIADKAPKNLDEADKFADSDKPAEIKSEVQGRVGEGKSDSAEQIATTTAAPPDTSAAVTKQVVPMAADRPPGTPATPDPAKAVPDKLPPSATDLSAGPASVNQQMTDAQVTEPQLKKANEPAFANALTEKKTAEQHSETAPDQLRTHESAQLKTTTAQAKRLGTNAMGAIAAQRVSTGQQVGTGKTGAKTRDEETRAQVTTILQKVFDTMKTDVEGILTGLDKLVDDQFSRGEKEARDAFTAEHKQKMEEYKDRRYSGAIGKVRWLDDLFTGLPEEANQIFVEARDHYVKRMKQVISDVANTIGRELTRAKDRIKKGREDLQNEVKKLPKDLQAIGKEAAAGFADQFDELTQSVDDKGTELVDTLATKYTDAVKSVDDEIAAEKEKNKGLVDKAINAVKGVIETILELKRLLLGVLAKAAQAVMGILKDPIGFLGNLIKGVGGGLKLFMKNAGRHLQQGVLAWLLGTAATAGIQLPTSFDVLGILLMIATLLGLSWPNIRARLARKVPDQAITAAETAVPLVAETRRRGVAGMWSDLKTRVGDLKKNLISDLVSYLLPTIIIAGITWIVSLFNPASAFIRACKMIIDIIRFIVTQGRQIIEFINAVLDAVIAIARGGTGGVPALIERALAKSIPVLIGALAAILGIGGIAGKVKQIFQKLARPVNRAIDWVIDKIVGLIKKLWAKLKPKPKKPRKPKPDEKEPKKTKKDGLKRQQKQLDAGLAAAVAVVNRFAGRTVGKRLITPLLKVVKIRHRMTSLTVAEENGHWAVIGVVNPKKSKPSKAKVASDAGLAALRDIHRAFSNAINNKLRRAWNNNTVKKKLAADPALKSVLQKEHDRLNRAMTGKTEAAFQALDKGQPTEADVSKLYRVYRSHIDSVDNLVERLEDLRKAPEQLAEEEKKARDDIRKKRNDAKKILDDANVIELLQLPLFSDVKKRQETRGRVLDEIIITMATMKLPELRQHALTAVKFLRDAEDLKRNTNINEAIDPHIKKIDDIWTNTAPGGREDAEVGDGSSEDAAKKEAETGRPIKKKAHGPKCKTEARGLRSAIAALRQLRGRTTEAAIHKRIDDAITKADERARKLDTGAAAWDNRVRDFPTEWTRAGESKKWTSADKLLSKFPDDPPFGRGI